MSLPAGPGDDSVLLTDLEPGDYVLTCFVTDGTTSVEQVLTDHEDESTDHRSHGMVATFTVSPG